MRIFTLFILIVGFQFECLAEYFDHRDRDCLNQLALAGREIGMSINFEVSNNHIKIGENGYISKHHSVIVGVNEGRISCDNSGGQGLTEYLKNRLSEMADTLNSRSVQANSDSNFLMYLRGINSSCSKAKFFDYTKIEPLFRCIWGPTRANRVGSDGDQLNCATANLEGQSTPASQ